MFTAVMKLIPRRYTADDMKEFGTWKKVKKPTDQPRCGRWPATKTFRVSSLNEVFTAKVIPPGRLELGVRGARDETPLRSPFGR